MDQRKVYVRLRDALVQNALEGKIISQKEMADHAKALKEYLARIDDMLALSERSATEAANAMMADARRAQWISGIAVTLVIALAALFGWLLRRSIVTPLAQASQVVSQVAAGDLTVRVNADRADEIGQMMTAVNRMVESLHYVVTEVRDSAESIHVAASEVATGNMDLSLRTEQAASNLEETSASVEQLTGMVLSNAGNTRQANDLVNQATLVASRGGEVVKQVVSTMNDINSSSQRIVEIVSIIDGIAFQTNILALNAAVEAARAGEQGRGFAVVASEVRSLAGRSANAAKEIKQLISASVDKVSNGAKLVITAGTTMDEIVGSVEKIQTIMTEVSEASHQQSDEIGQVGQAITLLDQMTQQNAALVEEGAAAAQSLSEQAKRLNSAMSSFRLHRVAGAAD
jgi:methyl-accepting chemotaxis protein